MKKECTIHIGMHKTGSTSIQATLQQYLNDVEYTYFDLKTINHSLRIFSLFSLDKVARDLQTKNFSTSEIVDFNNDTQKMIIENILHAKTPRMIISGENISLLSQKSLIHMKGFLLQYFEKITILGYVRSPKSYIQSMFQESVKRNGIGHFKLEKMYPSYRDKFEKFDIVFGRENVKLWKFDPKVFPLNDVSMDFCKKLNIHMDPKNIVHTNVTLSKESLSVLYIYRKYGSGFGKGKNVISENFHLIKLLGSMGKSKARFSFSLISEILEKNKNDIAWMENRLNDSLKENHKNFEDDIKKEEDLIQVNKEFVQVLTSKFRYNRTVDSLEDIVDLIHFIRITLARKHIYEKQGEEVKLLEIARKLQESDPEKFGKMNEKKLYQVIKAALGEIKSELSDDDKDSVKIQDFGVFKIKERKKEGTKFYAFWPKK